ncbi:double-strand-break repair protein rad21-like protein 1 [Cyprinodon tularosa]|uniref:double-strand-break repair protein rad21-like protein 1 n=1 Tax=Cyprinodon tularosa TaxID=77115 RepID=UPI0018E22F82|nr:double-strand-break repair protein rad21-like protein 1 [Cyprinodon tularosa]
MMFFTQLFTSSRGPLAKIWLAAHWEKKLTKTQVFECNLETTIRDILSPKMAINLRTFGHLLFGVVRIYSRKTKYLFADCNNALANIKITFRPGQTDMPVEGLESTLRAITLVEDFSAFDAELPLPCDIDVMDHLSLNQSRSEEITMKDDLGHQYLNLHDINTSQSQANTLLDTSLDNFEPQRDGFGDEENGYDLLDFLANSSDLPEFTNFILEGPQLENQEILTGSADNHEMDVDSRDPEVTKTPRINGTTLVTNNESIFLLEPVPITPNSERKLGKRKRRLVVDQAKELSDHYIKEQLSDYSDMIASFDMAPSTVRLMHWMEDGGTNKLFSTPCSNVASPQINELFAKSVFQLKHYSFTEEVEQIRQEEQKAQRDLSSITTGSVVDSSVGAEKTINTELTAPDLMNGSQEVPEGETMEFSHPELPSEDSMFVHPSDAEQSTQSTSLHTQSLLSGKDKEEREITRKTQRLLKDLKQRETFGDPRFSIKSLCEGSNRWQAASTFFCLLALKKQQIVQLHQSAPYQDISVTPGPKYYT